MLGISSSISRGSKAEAGFTLTVEGTKVTFDRVPYKGKESAEHIK
jgi:hypothetical protein